MVSCAFIIYFISFIAGNQAHYWCTKTREERQQAVCEQYAKAFDSDEALHPYHYIDKNWPAEKYSGGCYVSFMPCGVMTTLGKLCVHQLAGFILPVVKLLHYVLVRK